MAKRNWFDWLTLVLVLIGGINWGLVGLFKFDLLVKLFGVGTFTNVLYDLVGLSALYVIYLVANE